MFNLGVWDCTYALNFYVLFSPGVIYDFSRPPIVAVYYLQGVLEQPHRVLGFCTLHDVRQYPSMKVGNKVLSCLGMVAAVLSPRH
jgi:hypothetical protein